VAVTTLVPEAVDFWLRQQLRKTWHDAIAAYAAEAAGTYLDLDAAGMEYLARPRRQTS